MIEFILGNDFTECLPATRSTTVPATRSTTVSRRGRVIIPKIKYWEGQYEK